MSKEENMLVLFSFVVSRYFTSKNHNARSPVFEPMFTFYTEEKLLDCVGVVDNKAE